MSSLRLRGLSSGERPLRRLDLFELQVWKGETGRSMTELATVADDTPLRLSIAAELAFPQGGITASGLRREAERGNLAIERIAGKDYTTLASIKRMRELCRVVPKDQGCGSNQRGETKPEKSPSRPSGASGMDQSNDPQASALAKLRALRKPRKTRSADTSTPRPRRATATVTHLRSRSQP